MKIYITRISRKIKNLREEKKLTQEELAERLGISRQSIISVEKGKSLPSLPLALRLSDIFNATLEEIFNPQHNPPAGGKKGGEEMPHSIRPWSPFGDLDRFFDDDDAAPGWTGRRAFNFPAVNVKETDKDVLVTADIPGIKEEEMQIEVGENFVDLSGERREEEKEEKKGYFHQEVRYGSFSRRIPLPSEVDPGKAEATVKNGTLKLVLPKLEPAKPKTTKIKVKKG